MYELVPVLMTRRLPSTISSGGILFEQRSIDGVRQGDAASRQFVEDGIRIGLVEISKVFGDAG